MPKVTKAAKPLLTDYEKRVAIAREVGGVEFLGERFNGPAPRPTLTNMSEAVWAEHAADYRFIVMEDGSVFRDCTPIDLYKRWYDAEVAIGHREAHTHGASFSMPELFAIYDHNTHASLRVKYVGCYWLGPEGIKAAVTDRFTNNVEYAGMSIEQAVTVMDMLKAMVA